MIRLLFTEILPTSTEQACLGNPPVGLGQLWMLALRQGPLRASLHTLGSVAWPVAILLGVFQFLTAPESRPLMMYFWKNRAKITGGITARTPAAMMVT